MVPGTGELMIDVRVRFKENLPVYYWPPDNAKAELDFAVQHGGRYITF